MVHNPTVNYRIIHSKLILGTILKNAFSIASSSRAPTRIPASTLDCPLMLTEAFEQQISEHRISHCLIGTAARVEVITISLAVHGQHGRLGDDGELQACRAHQQAVDRCVEASSVRAERLVVGARARRRRVTRACDAQPAVPLAEPVPSPASPPCRSQRTSPKNDLADAPHLGHIGHDVATRDRRGATAARHQRCSPGRASPPQPEILLDEDLDEREVAVRGRVRDLRDADPLLDGAEPRGAGRRVRRCGGHDLPARRLGRDQTTVDTL